MPAHNHVDDGYDRDEQGDDQDDGLEVVDTPTMRLSVIKVFNRPDVEFLGGTRSLSGKTHVTYKLTLDADGIAHTGLQPDGLQFTGQGSKSGWFQCHVSAFPGDVIEKMDDQVPFDLLELVEAEIEDHIDEKTDGGWTPSQEFCEAADRAEEL